MQSTLKKMEPDSALFFELNFESVPNIIPETSQFKDALALLEDTANENEKKKIIKQIVSSLKSWLFYLKLFIFVDCYI